jgi:lipopolysaccharide biosynthesis glycosyltransferase
MKNEKVNIVICGDHNFVMPMGVLIYSACVNNRKGSLRYFLITDESLTDEDKRKLSDIVEAFQDSIRFVRVDADEVRKKMHFRDGFYKVQTIYRLFITELLPADIDKVIYIDGDAVVRHSLDPLFNTDISNVGIAACPDAQEGRMDNFNRLGFPASYGYFNSGVLLINLKYWRDNDILGKIASLIEEDFTRFQLFDQDILNYLFHENKKILSFKYNLQSDALFKLKNLNLDYWKYHADLDASREDPVILHFSGYRPWEKGCTHPYKDEFFKYRDQTVWRNDPLWPNRTPRLMQFVNKHRRLLQPFGVGIVEDPFDRTLKLRSSK